MKHARRNRQASAAFFSKRFALGTLCMLVLSATLSACPAPPLYPDFSDSKEALLRGMRIVLFDKNGGDTEAVPAIITLHSPATTVARLPEPPTRAGHTFVGWNTSPTGSGTRFDTEFAVPTTNPLVVYAQWETNLEVQLSRNSITFTPMKDGAYNERSLVFTVTVSGFRNKVAADWVTLEAHVTAENEPQWLSWHSEHGPYLEGVQTFAFFFVYHGTDFSEGPATLSIQPKGVPMGHQYVDGPKTLHIAATTGQDKNRPIPVHQGNMGHFNRYANTDEGRGLHYQLVENVTLPKPAEGKSNWAAIGTYGDIDNDHPFTGSFDGGGHSISGLIIFSPDDGRQGMFSYIGSSAEIKNLGLEGGSITGGNFIGSLVGGNFGTVQNCYATGSVTGGNSAGGLVGYSRGTVHNSYATGSATGGNYVGGLVGYNYSGTVHNSYATSSVTGDIAVGGLVGYNFPNGTVHNSYATGSVTGRDHVGGLLGADRGVQNSIALNPSAIATGINVGRVVAGSVIYMSGNYARNNMKLESEGNPYVPTVANSQADKKDGASTAAFNTRGFWTSTLSWDFSENGAWEWREGFLPILRGVGGKQSPRVQEVQ